MWMMPFLDALISPILNLARANGDYHGYGMMWGGGWGGMGVGLLFMVVIVALIVVAVVLLVRWLGGTARDDRGAYMAPPRKSPLDILKERFARGEIDKQEFEERRRILEDRG